MAAHDRHDGDAQHDERDEDLGQRLSGLEAAAPKPSDNPDPPHGAERSVPGVATLRGGLLPTAQFAERPVLETIVAHRSQISGEAPARGLPCGTEVAEMVEVRT